MKCYDVFCCWLRLKYSYALEVCPFLVNFYMNFRQNEPLYNGTNNSDICLLCPSSSSSALQCCEIYIEIVWSRPLEAHQGDGAVCHRDGQVGAICEAAVRTIGTCLQRAGELEIWINIDYKFIKLGWKTNLKNHSAAYNFIVIFPSKIPNS